MMEPADRPIPFTERAEPTYTTQERRAFAPLRVDLNRLLDTLALVDGLPSRRTLDPELREAVRAARVANARVLLVLNRMEGREDESGKAPPVARPDEATTQTSEQ